MGEQVQWILGEGVLHQEERAAPEIWSTDMGWGGGAPDQGPGKVVGEGNTTQHTPESRFVPSFLGKGPSASLEEGKVGRETPLQDK